MEMRIVEKTISKGKLAQVAEEGFGDMVKAVVDVAQGIMAIGGELHADMEVLLSEERESKRENTWGINLYPEKEGDDFIEFNSMINLKPAQGNRTRSVENENIRNQIKNIVGKFISEN